MSKSIAQSKSTIWLSVILLLGFVLRVWGIGFGLPLLNHADEPIVVNHALAYGLGDFNPHFFKLPPLTSYLLFFVYGFYFMFGFFFGIFPNTEAFLQSFLTDPTAFYVLGRLTIGCFFGIASIYMMYRLTRFTFPRQIALLAAFMLSVSFLPVQLSHFVYADSPLLFLLILALFFYMRIYRRGRLTDYLAALFVTGAAIAMKYNAALLAVPLMTAHIYRAATQSKQSVSWNFVVVPLLCFLGVLFSFFIFNPFFFIDIRFALSEVLTQSASTGATNWFHHLFYSLKEGLGLPLFIFALTSFLVGVVWVRRSPYLLIFYAMTIIFYLHLVFFSQSYARYGILLVPSAIFFTTFLLNQIYQKVNRFFLVLIITLCIGGASLYQDILLGSVLSRVDTRNMAREWITENLPQGSRIFVDVDRFFPKLPFCKDELYEALAQVDPESAKAKRLRTLIGVQQGERCFHLYTKGKAAGGSGHQFSLAPKRIPMDMKKFKEHKIKYVGITHMHSAYPPQEFMNQLKDKSTLIARFSPYWDDDVHYSIDPNDLTGAPTMLKDLKLRSRNGHLIEIYRLGKK